jgi:hypothetical protein
MEEKEMSVDIIEVAKKCGLSCKRFDCCSPKALDRFADHYRKEGAEEYEKTFALRKAIDIDEAVAKATKEANKTIEELRTRLSGQTCFVPPEFQAEMDELKQQLSATELVVEQMRDDIVAAEVVLHRMNVSVPTALMNCKKLQPSLYALREHEAKVLEEARAQMEPVALIIRPSAPIADTKGEKHE